jgi:hypothetical protein
MDNKYADPEYEKEVKELKDRLIDLQKEYRDTLQIF